MHTHVQEGVGLTLGRMIVPHEVVTGYLGPVQNAFGQTMTEYSIGVNMDGKEVEIPTFVPGLSADELRFLTTTDGSQPIPQSIVNKAVDHARMRMQRGLSPWHDSGPNHTKRGGY